MEQLKALNALEPFLALSKSASSSRAAADLVIRATSAPNTFIFTELLSAPQIQALANSEEYSSHLTLLQIFSYGTYSDYVLGSGLPTLNEAQTQKLRQLSFLTLAKNPADLSYGNLQQALGLNNSRELEDLVISAIYAGLITGTLDPYHQLVTVSSVAALRDLSPNSIPSMLSTLNEWSARCVSTLADLEKHIASIKAEAAKRHKDETEWAAQVEKLLDGKHTKESSEEPNKTIGGGNKFGGLGKLLGSGGASKRGSGGLDDDGMDVDQESDDETRATRSSKKRGFGLGFGKS